MASIADSFQQDLIKNHETDYSNNTWKSWNGYTMNLDKRKTIENIGENLSSRMKESIRLAGGNTDIVSSYNPLIGFPGEVSVDGRNVIGNDFYTKLSSDEETDDNKIMNSINGSDDGGFDKASMTKTGDPRQTTFVDLTSPGLAMGEASVLNPDFQFNELDDVRSDYRRPYIGRCYSERIYDYNLPKIFFEVGTVEINLGLVGVLTTIARGNSSEKSLSKYLRDPGGNSLRFGIMKLGSMIRGLASFGANNFLKTKRLYNFTSTNRVYIRYVNEALIELASWMNLGKVEVIDKNNLDTYMKQVSEMEEDEKIENTLDNENDTYIYDETYGLPGTGSYMGLANSLNVLNILPQFGNKKNNEVKAKSNAEYKDDDSLLSSIQRAQLFIPFALQRGVSVSETFSNTTQEHPIVTQLNGESDTASQQRMVGVLGKEFSEAATSAIKGAASGQGLGKTLQELAGKLAPNFTRMASGEMGGELGMVRAGNARLVLPEVWSDSSFDRQYSLNWTFRAPYGHRLCIFENCMVPIIFLQCMASARQISTSSYTNPFYIKAFSKGLVTCEMGMVSSLTVNRSENKNDRTQEGFSRSVSVGMSIKDVVPKLALSLDAGVWGILSAHNVGFREYISFIAGVDLMDRLKLENQLKVGANVLANIYNFDNFKNNLRFSLSQTLPAKIFTNPRSIFYKEETNKDLKSSIGVPTTF